MFKRSVIKRVYLLISLIFTIQFLAMSFNQINSTRQLISEEKKTELIEIVIALENNLPMTYTELLKVYNGEGLSDIEKREILNKRLQPIIDNLALKWPGYGMGFYSSDLKILALAPFNKDLIGKVASTEALEIYEKKEMQISKIQDGFTWGGSTILAINDPIFISGQMVGHVWANIKIDNIASVMLKAIIKNSLIYLFIWAAIILTIRWSIRKIEKSIIVLNMQINNESLDLTKFVDLPQFVPVLDTVQELKRRLQKEYEERYRIQEEISKLDRLNTVGEMAASVAHEIRNPMTVIMGYIQLIAAKDKEHTNKYDLIINELKHVNHIIEDYLSIVRIKKIPKNLCQLNNIVNSTYPLIYAESVNKGIEVVIKLQPDLPSAPVDEKEIKQVILNLIRNSVDVMDGAGVLTICTEYQQAEEFITLKISDSGCGIPEETINNIFEPFFTTKESGTGLGLCVCKNIIERHKGTIIVTSKLGEGTTFSINLPIAIPEIKGNVA